MKVQTEDKQKKKPKTKKTSTTSKQYKHNLTINNQNPSTLHHDCQRPRRDDRYEKMRNIEKEECCRVSV